MHIFFLIMKHGSKPLNPEGYDRLIYAKILDKNQNKYLHELVLKHMIRDPFGEYNKNSTCMRNGKCKNKDPNEFSKCTTHAEDGYPCYRRRRNDKELLLETIELIIHSCTL